MAHMHYKGTGNVHSFRGLLADDDQRKIRIQGSVGAIAWRITKFEVFPESPGTLEYEGIAKIYREEQSALVGTVNFDDDELLGIAYYASTNSKATSPMITIFDNALFVRNIYVSQVANTGTASLNYYIELEEVKVSAAGMAQLAVAAARRTID